MRDCKRSPVVPSLAVLLLVGCGAASEPAPAAPLQTQTVVVALTPLPDEPAPHADAPDADAPEAAPEPPPPRSSGEGTPPFIAKFAVVFRDPGSSNPDDPFSGDKLLLLRDRTSCQAARAVPEADRVSVSMRWQPGSMSFQHVSLKDGKLTRYGGTIAILAAPTGVGATGRLQVDPGERGNLGGGEIPALVCE